MNKWDVQTGLYRVCTHSSNTDENMNVLMNNESCKCLKDWVCVKEPDGRSSSSVSVFAIMLLKRLPDGSKQKRWLPG